MNLTNENVSIPEQSLKLYIHICVCMYV